MIWPSPPSEAEWLAIGQAITAITAIFAWIQSRHNARQQVEIAMRQAVENTASRAAIQEVHLTINSRLTEFKEQTDKLLIASVAAAFAQGRAEAQADKTILTEKPKPPSDAHP